MTSGFALVVLTDLPFTTYEASGALRNTNHIRLMVYYVDLTKTKWSALSVPRSTVRKESES
jgi:hypothetical protein